MFYIPFIPLNKCLLWWLLLLSPIFIPFSLEYFIELLSAKVMEKIGILYISYVGSMYSFSLLSYWGGCAWVLEMPFNPRIQKSLNQKEAFRNNWPLLHAWLCQWPMKWMDDQKKKKCSIPFADNSHPDFMVHRLLWWEATDAKVGADSTEKLF